MVTFRNMNYAQSLNADWIIFFCSLNTITQQDTLNFPSKYFMMNIFCFVFIVCCFYIKNLDVISVNTLGYLIDASP